jgi:excisionase family DNA binding protein
MTDVDAVSGPHPSLWDANDVARYLKVSRSWVYQRAESGLLPCLRVGGLVRFDPEAVHAFAHGDVRPTRLVRTPVKSR